MNDLPDAVREAFERVKEWGSGLKDKPTNTPYFRNMVMGLVLSMVKQQHYLTIGYQNSPLLLAWACRNLLELDVITQYCLMSPQNGLDFADDMWLDAIHIFESSRKWIQHTDPAKQTPELDQTIAKYHAEKTKRGLTRNKYLAVKELAVAVGMQAEYRAMYRVTSKLVHPTAFSLLAFAEEGELKQLMPFMFHSGNSYALEVYKTVKPHVDKNGMEP